MRSTPIGFCGHLARTAPPSTIDSKMEVAEQRDQKALHRFWALVAVALVAYCAGYTVVGLTSSTPSPVCVVIHQNGAPAPASCQNPDAYQVTP